MEELYRIERGAASSRRTPRPSPTSSVRGNEPSRSSDPSAGATPSSRLVLVVDDTEDTRELYRFALADAGYRVIAVENGQEALDAIACAKPALVIMDLSMPVMDGWEATARIKAEAATADIIVIAVTAHATNLGMARATDAGASLVLTKPCLPDDVVNHVRELLAGS